MKNVKNFFDKSDQVKRGDIEKAIKAWLKIEELIKSNDLSSMMHKENLNLHLREFEELMNLLTRVISQIYQVSKNSLEIMNKMKDDHLRKIQ